MSQISGTNFLRQSVLLRAYFLLALLGIFCSDALVLTLLRQTPILPATQMASTPRA